MYFLVWFHSLDLHDAGDMGRLVQFLMMDSVVFVTSLHA